MRAWDSLQAVSYLEVTDLKKTAALPRLLSPKREGAEGMGQPELTERS